MGKISSALREKCPRCDKGDLFEYKKYLPISSKPFQMKEYCPNCGLKYEREIGFYYGAMYVSYGLNVGLLATLAITYYLFLRDIFTWLQFGIGFFLFTLLLIAVIFRFSRSIWLTMFTKYEPEKRNEVNLKSLETKKSQLV